MLATDQHRALANALPVRIVKELHAKARCTSPSFGGACTPPEKARLGTHVYMHRYCTHKDWETMQDEKVSCNGKLNVLTNRAFFLGLVNPSHTAMVSMAALLRAAQNKGNVSKLTTKPVAALHALRAT